MIELHKYHSKLFSTTTARDVLTGLMKQVDEEINKLSPVDLSSQSETDLVEGIVSKLILTPITITQDRIISDPRVSSNSKTWEIIQIFSGSKILLLLKGLEGPVEHPLALPTGSDGDKTIRWNYNLEVNDSLEYANDQNLKTIRSIQEKLVPANRAANEINRELHEYANRKVHQRIKSFNSDNELINRLKKKE